MLLSILLLIISMDFQVFLKRDFFIEMKGEKGGRRWDGRRKGKEEEQEGKGEREREKCFFQFSFSFVFLPLSFFLFLLIR